MIKLKNIILTLFLSIILFSTSALGATLIVGAGSASYSTDGTDDQATIQNAINAAQSGDTVSILPGTYYLSGPFTMKTGVSLQGSGIDSTILKCVNPTVNFATSNIILCNQVSNIYISGFTVDGGWPSLDVMHSAANNYREYEQGVSIKACSYIYVHDIKFQLSMGDFVHCSSGSSQIQVYNTISTPGHDSFDAWGCQDCFVFNNLWDTFENSCCKIAGSQRIEISHNTFYTDTGSGNAGVEIMAASSSATDDTGLSIHNNIFKTIRLIPVYTDLADGNPTGTISVTSNYYYNCDSPLISTSNSNVVLTQSGNTAVTSIDPNWGANGYGYVSTGSSPSTGTYDGSTLPTLTLPTSTQVLSTTNGNIYFYWQNVGSTNYRLRVSNVTSFATTVYDSTSANIPIGVALTNGTYYWDVAAHDDVHNSWTAYTPYSSFTVSGNTIVTLNGGLYGTVKDTTTNTPVKGVVVTVSNNSWSDSYTTGEDGLYEFSLGASTGTYYVSTTATNYISVNGLPVNMTGTQVKLDIPLTENANYFSPHYVRLVVVDSTLHRYGNVLVDVYGDNNPVSNGNPSFSSYTDESGKAVFELQQNTMYTIVTTLNGVSQTDTIMPDNTEYFIFIPAQNTATTVPQFYETTNITVTKSTINDTAAYINVTYYDSDAKTNYVGFVLGSIVNNKFQVYPVVGTQDDWDAPTGGSATDSFIVRDYLGKTFTLNINIDSSSFGAVTKSVPITFPGNNLPFRGSIELSYLALFVLLIIALMFDRSTHHLAGIICVGFYYIMYFMGIWDPLFAAQNISPMYYGYIFPAVAGTYAILVYLNQAETNGAY